MKKERRKYPRVLYRCSVILWREAAPQRINAYTKNVGRQGACIILDEELPIHQEVRLQIELDDTLPPIVCNAEVVWTLAYRMGDYPLKSSTRFQTGFNFLDLNETDRARLARIISERG